MTNLQTLNDARVVLAAVLAECESLAGSLALIEHEEDEASELAAQIARLRALQGKLDALAPRYYILTDDQNLYSFATPCAREEAAERISASGALTYYLALNPADAPDVLRVG